MWKLGPYRVDDVPFAAGATAEVFTARRGRTGERVAVKVLPLRTYRARAEAEAQVSTIDHPRLVNVHESIVDERRGVVGLVMDLASDGDLRSALRSGAGPTPLEMFQITDDVLAALEALHAVGLLHRDVKPENVLLERVGGVMRARLGDLGIARPIDRTRSTGSVLGTDLYIAPEVHDGSAPSPASDLWAVGYVMYEGLFGAPPHADAATSYQAIGRLRAEGPDRPPRVPDDLWRVVSALLAPDPASRPRSAREARTLLRTAREAAEAASTAVDEPKPLVRPGARRRSTARDNESGLMRPVPAVYDRAPAVARALSVAASVLLIVGGLAWLGGRADLGGSGDGGAPQVISAVEPLTPDSPAVVPTQYRWRLDHGVLSGHLEVKNKSTVTTAATSVPELFPASATRSGRLAISGDDGPAQRQGDGSVLVHFSVPPLAARANHVIVFEVKLEEGVGGKGALNRLLRDRIAAISRSDFAVSGAPTIEQVAIVLDSPTLVVGGRAVYKVTGVTRDGKPAPADLLKDAAVQVVNGEGVVQLDGIAVMGIAPGSAVLRVVIGELHADAPVTVTAPTTSPPTPPKTTVKPHREPTTRTTIIEEDAPSPPPTDAEIL